MKILLFDKAACGKDVDYSSLEAFGEIIDLGVVKTEERMLEIAADPRYADAEILLCNKAPVTASVMAAYKNLRYIGVFATGYNNIDIPEAKKRSITVCNVPGYSTDAVAQTVFALILQIASCTDAYTRDTREGKWVNYPIFSMLTHESVELRGKTLGILGYGAIGKKVAQIGDAFGMRVIVCTRTERPDCPFPYVDKDALLTESDYLSLNAPLNAGTENFINTESIAKMKTGAVLINTARGGLVDEQALADALQSGKLKAAGLDVLRSEPMAPDCPLLGLENCHITPHVAWAAKETRQRLIYIVADNLRAYLGGSPQNVVC